MYDPDAPMGSGWWHWVVYNIPATAQAIATGAGDAKKNALPAGATAAFVGFNINGNKLGSATFTGMYGR